MAVLNFLDLESGCKFPCAVDNGPGEFPVGVLNKRDGVHVARSIQRRLLQSRLEHAEGQIIGGHPLEDVVEENQTDGVNVLSQIHHVGNGAETRSIPGMVWGTQKSTVMLAWSVAVLSCRSLGLCRLFSVPSFFLGCHCCHAGVLAMSFWH